MASLRDVAPNYERAREIWPEALTLGKSYQALLSCFNGDGHGMVEYIKAYLECVFVTIIAEFDAEPPQGSTPNTTELFQAALKPLGLENTRAPASSTKCFQASID